VDKSQDLTVTFAQRGGTHGSFAENAQIAMTLRSIMRATGNWENLLPEQRLALDEIALKLARILSLGSAHNFKEHWHDIQGYAKLGENACMTTSSAPEGQAS